MQAAAKQDKRTNPKERKILITGAAKRLGSYLATACIEDGWHVVLHCHQSQDAAQALIASWQEKWGHDGIKAEIVTANLADRDECA